MMEQNSRQPRKVAIADHIWEAFEEMAGQMGTDRDGLVNQAMFMFARLNGFLMAGGGAAVAAPAAAAANGAARANGASPAPSGRPGPPVPSQVGAKPIPGPGTSRPPPRDAAEDPARREVAERVLETAAELERLIKGKNQPEEEEEAPEEEPPAEDVDGMGDEMDVADEQPPEEEEAPAEEGGALYLMSDAGEMDKIVKDRFVIGRGKHCDFVINSGKVSREHAVIVREGSDFFIEDLGSSNGTWFNKQRIKRRKIEDGDEYFICSEKIKLVMR